MSITLFTSFISVSITLRLNPVSITFKRQFATLHGPSQMKHLISPNFYLSTILKRFYVILVQNTPNDIYLNIKYIEDPVIEAIIDIY